MPAHGHGKGSGGGGGSAGQQEALVEKYGLKGILKWSILLLCYIIAFSTRLFAVLRFESVIHEFDPYFNFRATKFLSSEGFDKFHNWFDDRAWYPLGRIVGGTIYPGLMMTAAVLHQLLHWLSMTMSIRNICVFLAPWMASNTTLIAYLLTKEVVTGARLTADEQTKARANGRRAESAGLLAAAFIAIVPGYISRSVAGSYDNEGVAIFAMLLTFFLWLRAVNLGSMAWAAAAALGYLYMAGAWGGYIFVLNIITLHVFVLLLAGRYTHRAYVAYSTFYVVATLLSMQVPFVGFQPVYSSEHLAGAAVFGLLQLAGAISWARSHLSDASFATAERSMLLAGVALAAVAVALGAATGYLAPLTGRFYTLLDPSYDIPVIASVSEHQPTAWSSFFFDLHCLVFLMPAGMYLCISKPNDGKVFLALYGITSTYFSAVMVRLVLVLAPAACILGAIALSDLLGKYMGHVRRFEWAAQREDSSKRKRVEHPEHVKTFALLFVAGMTLLLSFYALHCSWVTAEAYSSPSIVLAAKQNDGSRLLFDDFREAYSWLRLNSKGKDTKVLSWWDFGYQLAAVGNVTTIVDNNTWNNTHLATAGRVFASSEEDALPMLQSLDVDYVMVVFGGVTGYSGDDVAKFVWMVRIAASVFPDIKEEDYFGGGLRVGSTASAAMMDSLMYKLCYYRFGDVTTDYRQPTGYDRVRGTVIGNKDVELTHLEEAFTSEHWLVRLYKVHKSRNLWPLPPIDEE